MMIKIRPSDKNDGQSFGSSTIGDGSEFSILLLSRIWHSTHPLSSCVCRPSHDAPHHLLSDDDSSVYLLSFINFFSAVAASLNTFLSIFHNSFL